jgi:hypothetical protein
MKLTRLLDSQTLYINRQEQEAVRKVSGSLHIFMKL